jgi:methylated-DNA-protein-cysteine methyltransferase-like protein
MADKMFAAFWRTIRKVPRGKVATYGDIAYAAGFPGAARQVAWALHAHGHELPWQRIVGAGGRILLSGEHGFEQRMRLEQEGVRFLGLRIDMKEHQYSFFKAKNVAGSKAPRARVHEKITLRKKATRKRAAKK